MDAYLAFLFALPIAGLLTAIVLIITTPGELSGHSHLNVPHHPTVPHR
jgi:hypothetical protein